MKICLNTDGLSNMSFEEMVSTCASLGIESLEIACGNWSNAPHIDLDKMLSSKDARTEFMKVIEGNGLTLDSLNCSGNQLAPNEEGRKNQEVVEKTFQLANLLGVRKIIMMSGLPGGNPTDTCQNWITTCWPPAVNEMLRYQWEDVLIPYWQKAVESAKALGIKAIALENHSTQCVYNASTLLRLREAVGPMVGMNLDPSHLMWMGGDAVEAAKLLGADAIYHIHAKDTRKEREKYAANGCLETADFGDYNNRAWNYVALGYGESTEWWKEFFSIVSMLGYTGTVSLEVEDKTMSPLTSVEKSLAFLREVLPQ